MARPKKTPSLRNSSMVDQHGRMYPNPQDPEVVDFFTKAGRCAAVKNLWSSPSDQSTLYEPVWTPDVAAHHLGITLTTLNRFRIPRWEIDSRTKGKLYYPIMVLRRIRVVLRTTGESLDTFERRHAEKRKELRDRNSVVKLTAENATLKAQLTAMHDNYTPVVELKRKIDALLVIINKLTCNRPEARAKVLPILAKHGLELPEPLVPRS